MPEMDGYGEVTQRQRLQPEWRQEALKGACVVVLSGRRAESAAWFCRYLAALGVGEIALASRDATWAAAAVESAEAVNPFVEARAVPVSGAVAPWIAGLAVSFAPGGEGLATLGGEAPFWTVPLDDPAATPGALAEGLVRVAAAAGAYDRLRPTDRLFAATAARAVRPFGLLALGCGALTNSLLAALRLAGLHPDALWLVDHDRVDPSNLNRQILFRYSDQGRLKSEVLAEQARGLFPECAVTPVGERFRPEHLDRFTAEVGGIAPVVALLTDDWACRVAATEAGANRGVELFLYAGTSFDTAKVRLFGPGVEGSWCLACGAERARDRAAEDAAVPSCSRTPDASMVLPNVVGAVEAVSLLSAWLQGEPFPCAGREISLVSETRLVDGPRMAPCSCVAPKVRVGRGVTGAGERPVFFRQPSPAGVGEVRVVGDLAPDRNPVALLLLPPGLTATKGVGREPEAGVLLLRGGERSLMGGEVVAFHAEGFALPSTETDGLHCSFCFTPVSPTDEVEVCRRAHPLCPECAREGCCPLCGGDRA
jgi:hypothetical protein